jgi:hypothetical protein
MVVGASHTYLSEKEFRCQRCDGSEKQSNTNTNGVTFDLEIGQGSGYNGFCAIFSFDGSGKFLEHGVWE